MSNDKIKSLMSTMLTSFQIVSMNVGADGTIKATPVNTPFGAEVDAENWLQNNIRTIGSIGPFAILKIYQ